MKRDEYAKMFALEDRYWWFKSKRLFLQAALGTVDTRLPAGPRILDIGCGTGAVLEMLSSYGETHGIDMSRKQRLPSARSATLATWFSPAPRRSRMLMMPST